MEGDKKAIPVEIEQPEIMDVNVLDAKDVHDYDHSQTVNLDLPTRQALTEGLGRNKPTPQPGRSNIHDVLNLPPSTTAQEDLGTAGQRRVNLIWEGTQAAVALLITGSTIYAVLTGRESIILGNAFTLIVALYFVRTNHTKTGGVGGTDSAESRKGSGNG